MHYAITVTGAERGFLFLYSQNNKNLKLEVMSGVSEELWKENYSFETYGVSREIIRVVENTGRSVIRSQEDISISQGFSDLKHYGVKQALCVPFQSRGRLLGFLYLDHSFDKELFCEQALGLIESFATLTSLSIENTFLTRNLEKRRLKNISVSIKPSTSVPDLKIISIKGILDSITMKHVDEKIFPVIEHEASDVIIDLRDVTYANKSSIIFFMKCMIHMNHHKKKLKFVMPPQHVYKTFKLAGFSKRFDMYTNMEDALNTLY
jgi:anti-anti-sigma factor